MHVEVGGYKGFLGDCPLPYSLPDLLQGSKQVQSMARLELGCKAKMENGILPRACTSGSVGPSGFRMQVVAGDSMWQGLF